ncbi:hypothetical protein DEQ92_06385 [Haloferax sp. Atlit-6N]|nr:hypothetical protein DEQ92_06385 [Haloferax sp. Atlit-6N]
MSNTGAVLQVIALSLPAVALYMGVLSDIYEDAALARSMYPDPSSDAFQGPGPATGEIENKVHREYVTLTTVMDGLDFRLATLSLVALTLSVVLLLPTLVTTVQSLYWAGVGIATIGFGLLVAALSYTAYATFFEMYPRS